MSTATKEAKRITIEGNLVRLERTVVEREAKAEDFMVELARMQPVATGVLPSGCVLYSRTCDAEQRTRTLFALERPPGIQPVRYKPVSTKEDVLELKLAWPRTLWFCRTSQGPNTELASIVDLWVTVTKAPIQPAGAETALYCLPMPNIYDNGCGAVCFGNLRLEDANTPLCVRIVELIEQVLDSNWNTDLMPEFEGLGIKDLADWAAQTAAEPECYKQIRYKPHLRGTVAGMLRHLATHPA